MLGACPYGDVPGSGYTSTEAIHVEATMAAYNCRYTRVTRAGLRGKKERGETCLEQHDGRVRHLHKGERRRREERLYHEWRFERDMDEKYG